MQKKLKILFLIATSAFLIIFILGNPAFFHSLLEIPAKTFLLVAALYILFFFSNAIILKKIIEPYGYKIPIQSCIGINQISSVFNYLAPFRAGQYAVKLTLMKIIYSVPFLLSSFTFFLASFLSLLTPCFILLILLIFFPNKLPFSFDSEFSLVTFLLFAFLFIMASLMIAKKREALKDKFKAYFSSFKVPNYINLIIIFISSFFQIIISSVIMVQILDGVSIEITFIDGLVFAAVSTGISLASITPGNIGTKELTLVATGAFLGVPKTALLASLVFDRFIQIILSSIISVLYISRNLDVFKVFFRQLKNR